MELGAVDFLPWLSSRTKSIAIDKNTAASHTLHTVTAGTRFVVYRIWLQSEGNVDVTFKSGTTAISGAIGMVANQILDESGTVPVFRGDLVGENFVMTLSAGTQVNGFALVGEINS